MFSGRVSLIHWLWADYFIYWRIIPSDSIFSVCMSWIHKCLLIWAGEGRAEWQGDPGCVLNHQLVRTRLRMEIGLAPSWIYYHISRPPPPLPPPTRRLCFSSLSDTVLHLAPLVSPSPLCHSLFSPRACPLYTPAPPTQPSLCVM